jgi:hypothetical protein
MKIPPPHEGVAGLGAEARAQLLYRELRGLFDRRDLLIETFGDIGAAITYLPSNIRVRSFTHSTLCQNRTQCLVDVIVTLGLRESMKTGERLVN